MDTIELVAADTSALLRELAALARVIWRQHYTPIIGAEQVAYMLDRGYSETALGQQLSAGTRFSLARRNEHFVAFAAVSPDPLAPATAWLDKLYVRLDARRWGIGRRLVERTAGQAREFGATTLRLRVNRHNGNSIAAYRRVGFEFERADVKAIGNGFVMDDYILAAPLNRLASRSRLPNIGS